MAKPIMPCLFLEYRESAKLSREDHPFYSLIMAAMRKADTANTAKLKQAWPEVWKECVARYHAPGGALTQNELDWLEKQRGCD